MLDTTYSYSFEARINKYDYQKYFYTVVYIPDALTKTLDMESRMRLRVEVQVDGYPAKGTLMPDKIGSKQTEHLLKEGFANGQRVWYYQVPRRILRVIDKTYGDIVMVELRVGDQNEVEMHPAQEDFLHKHPRLQEIWDELTPGKRRTLSYPIMKAKSDETLEKRLAELEDVLLSL